MKELNFIQKALINIAVTELTTATIKASSKACKKAKELKQLREENKRENVVYTINACDVVEIYRDVEVVG